MKFVQIVDFKTSKIDEMREIGRDYEASGGGSGGAMVCADRDNPGRYLVIATFDDYESAMKNSEDPRTQELAKKMGELADGPPTFHNLDVLETFGE
jgi:hypothetical protein